MIGLASPSLGESTTGRACCAVPSSICRLIESATPALSPALPRATLTASREQAMGIAVIWASAGTSFAKETAPVTSDDSPTTAATMALHRAKCRVQPCGLLQWMHSAAPRRIPSRQTTQGTVSAGGPGGASSLTYRSEEHTSELQSQL